MREKRPRNRSRRLHLYLLAAAVLAGALTYGRTRAAPDPAPLIEEVFPDVAAIQLRAGIHHVYDTGGELLGWAGTGTAEGYGGPMVLLVGIDTVGAVVGLRVVEQRETPIFWKLARASEFLRAVTGSRFDEVDYDYENVVAVTGATVSSTAIVESVRSSIAAVAGTAFDVRLPLPRKPFEFGLLEMIILGLFAVGVSSHRVRGPWRRRLRWGCQIVGLIVLGFWKDSPITLAKITAFLSGFFPDLRTGLAIYLLLAGFLITSILYGRNLYCLNACPFGAAQRVVGAIGGRRLKLPTWSVRLMEGLRDTIVFVALFLAFLMLQPALASYEPFAVLFSMHGTTLQWLLLFIILVTSLVIHTPWCAFFCPMRTFEVVIEDSKRWVRGRRRKSRSSGP